MVPPCVVIISWRCATRLFGGHRWYNPYAITLKPRGRRSMNWPWGTCDDIDKLSRNWLQESIIYLDLYCYHLSCLVQMSHTLHASHRWWCGAKERCTRCTVDISEKRLHCCSQHFAWFMHDSYPCLCGEQTFLRHSCQSLTDSPQTGCSYLTTSWAFVHLTRRSVQSLVPGCL